MAREETSPMLVAGIPKRLRQQFHAACVSNDTTMKDQIKKMMQRYVDQQRRTEKG